MNRIVIVSCSVYWAWTVLTEHFAPPRVCLLAAALSRKTVFEARTHAHTYIHIMLFYLWLLGGAKLLCVIQEYGKSFPKFLFVICPFFFLSPFLYCN